MNPPSTPCAEAQGAEILLGPSPVAQRLREQVRRIAATPGTTVLVTGERGAGKAEVARAVHEAARAEGAPFAALPGACGASGLERALHDTAGGTIFLQEVGALGAAAQELLARALDERSAQSGATSAGPRVVASTSIDLEEQAAGGTFREDLLYRLNVLALHVPALRERRPDVLPIAEALLARFARELARPGLALGAAARERLATHAWPGNHRELRLVLERAALLAPGPRIRPADLALGGAEADSERHPAPGGRDDRSLRAAEAERIRRVLAEESGNKSRAARELGIHRATLHAKIRRLEAQGL